jgi:UDP-glucose:(glucosyl)LPS alpha-1,2-glucosyltransferase
MMVRLTAGAHDIVIGNDPGPGAYPTPRLLPVPAVWWPPFGRTNRYTAGVLQRLRTLQPPLVEIHNRANLALAIARALPKTRVALFLHNDPQSMRQAKRPQDRAILLRHMTVVCVSTHLSQRFAEGLSPSQRPSQSPSQTPRVLPNAIDLDSLPPQPATRDQMILFVGRAVADKGADAFVRAFAAIRTQIPTWRATLIGADRFGPLSPDTPFLRTLRPAAHAAGIDMPGYLPHTAVLAAMARAAIVVVPSRWQEPFGLTALEALASGAALICAPHGGLPEVAGQAALYAAPDPPGALETAILTLAQNPAQRAALAAAGRARAANFNAPAARIRLQALRRELLRRELLRMVPG